MTTAFTNDQGTGYLTADGITAGGLSMIGNLLGLPTQLIAAAGATQGAATAMTKMIAIIVTSTASARGIKLPTCATNAICAILSLCTQGTKIYPFLGDRIGLAATNAAVVLAGLKGNFYVGKDTVTWAVMKGA